METSRITERYSLDRQIGHGGSGAVWLGRDEVLGRTVALKRIGFPPGSVDPDVFRAEREARLAARVNHANVVAVFDLLETPDGHWLVMEYVDGTTLAAAIDERGPMPPDRAARVLGHVADALAAAHAAGIVHRDVKPSNILLGDDDSVKLTDFGIARQVADAALTQTGLVTGSPAYLSPEVASGRSATPASDVWSFGATMFHALAGRPPYDIGDNVLGAMYRILHEEPPRLRDAGWLAPLLEMTMSREPEERPTMAEVRDYLRAHVDVSPTQVLPAVPPPAPPAEAAVAPLPPPPAFPPAFPPAAPPPVEDTRKDRRVGVLAAVAGVAVAVLTLIGIVLLLGNDDDEPTAADPGRSPSASASQGSTAPSTPTDGTPSAPPTEEPTEQELVDYAESYVRTATTDPSAAFQQLTPSYQDRSPGYVDFWGSVSNPRFLDIAADPDRMQVTYTYRYDLAGEGSRVERVTLSLVRKGDQILIANATSSPA